MEQHEEPNSAQYPLGRGYGHDYMRGGEVFGGYGYREREDYTRTLGGQVGEIAGDGPRHTSSTATDDSSQMQQPAASADADGASDPASDSPVPHLEHTYGDIGAGWRHSRSYYVTQAQLQQRFYGPPPGARGPYGDRLRALRRPDADVRRDIEDVLFYDTWVDAERIGVDVAEGCVTLRGELANSQEVRYACTDAWSVAGVREVVSELSAREAELGRS